MSKILKKYIRDYLKESTIPIDPRIDIDKQQSELTPKIEKDMTSLSNEETIKYILKNLSDKTCISFVRTYDKTPPSFSINPRAEYSTPHGNYAYTLNLKNFKSLYKAEQIGGSEFALERPYFLLFKIKSPNIIVLNKDGTDNYKELLKNKRTNFDQDINRITRSFTYLLLSFFRSVEKGSKYREHMHNKVFSTFKKEINQCLSDLDNKKSGEGAIKNLITDTGSSLYNFLFRYIRITSDLPDSFKKDIFQFINQKFKEIVLKLANSELNPYYTKGEETSDFHKVYYSALILSKIARKAIRSYSSGPIFTLFLKEINIDGIIDSGTETIHQLEPSQVASLNFGNIDSNDVEFIGTFRNIFKTLNYREFDEIISKIYQEEGWKYEVDFFREETEEEKKDINIYDLDNIYDVIENAIEKSGIDAEVLDVEVESIISIDIEFSIKDRISESELTFYARLMNGLNSLLENNKVYSKMIRKFKFRFTDKISNIDITNYIGETFNSNYFKNLFRDSRNILLSVEIQGNDSTLDLDKNITSTISEISLYHAFDDEENRVDSKFIYIDSKSGKSFIINVKDQYSEEYIKKIFILDKSSNITVNLPE